MKRYEISTAFITSPQVDEHSYASSVAGEHKADCRKINSKFCTEKVLKRDVEKSIISKKALEEGPLFLAQNSQRTEKHAVSWSEYDICATLASVYDNTACIRAMGVSLPIGSWISEHYFKYVLRRCVLRCVVRTRHGHRFDHGYPGYTWKWGSHFFYGNCVQLLFENIPSSSFALLPVLVRNSVVYRIFPKHLFWTDFGWRSRGPGFGYSIQWMVSVHYRAFWYATVGLVGVNRTPSRTQISPPQGAVQRPGEQSGAPQGRFVNVSYGREKMKNSTPPLSSESRRLYARHACDRRARAGREHAARSGAQIRPDHLPCRALGAYWSQRNFPPPFSAPFLAARRIGPQRRDSTQL